MFRIVSCTSNDLEFVSIRLLWKQLCFTGHCTRSKQRTNGLLLWDRTQFVNCNCTNGASNANYPRQLLKAIGRVDGLVNFDEEVRKLPLDREVWRSRIKMIVAAKKEVNSSKRKDVKLGAVKLEVLLLSII
jgi:hypothetical protein